MAGEALRELVLGPMLAEDIPEVVELEKASFTMAWSETSFFNEIKKPGSISLVARAGSRIIGYICAGIVIDEAHILTLSVHPDYRGRGVASALVSGITDRILDEGCRFIYLEVRASNSPARSMYEKFHFEVIGTRKNYYIAPVEDALIMLRRLESEGS